MRKILLLPAACLSALCFAQTTTPDPGRVGINTSTPAATLDITAKALDNTTTEGVLVPRLTKANLETKVAKYGADQNGTLVFVTDVTTGSPTGDPTTAKTQDVDAPGFYYYDATFNTNVGKWTKVGGAAAQPINIISRTAVASPSIVKEDLSSNVNVIYYIGNATPGSFNLPDLAQADKGKMLYIYLATSAGGSYTVNMTPALNAATSASQSTIVNNRGGGYMWEGDGWIKIGF